jgi:hypothetical protein
LRRPDIEAVNPDQLQFPEFEHLPRLIRCKGHYIALEDSTLEQLLDFKRWYDSRLAVLLKRTEKFQQTGKELGKLIQLVERFTLTHPGINVRTVFALRTEQQAGRAKLTPEERREIAQQGARGRWGKK